MENMLRRAENVPPGQKSRCLAPQGNDKEDEGYGKCA